MKKKVLALVHGSRLAWIPEGSPVECNAYCTGDIHAEVVYGPDDEAMIRKAFAFWRTDRQLVDLKPAPEAPPPDMSVMVEVGIRPADSGMYGWLVFWKWETP